MTGDGWIHSSGCTETKEYKTMAIKRLSSESNESSSELKWLKEWFSSLSPKEQKIAKGATYMVTLVYKVPSGKGWLIETEHFKGWIWNNSPDGKQLVQDIERIRIGKLPLLLQLDDNSKAGFYLGIDPDLEVEIDWEVNEEGTEFKTMQRIPF